MLGCRSEKYPVLVVPPPSPTSRIQLTPIDLPALRGVRCDTGREAAVYAILEIIGAGVGCIDFDEDGRCDLFFPCGGDIDADQSTVLGKSCNLLRNLAPNEAGDVTAAARLAAEDLYAHGVAAADFNGDGYSDLIVYGFHGLRLYVNMGDGTFTDATQAAGLANIPWSTSVAWFDADSDGQLDLYGTGYVNWSFENNPECIGWWGGRRDVCPPMKFDALPDWFCRFSEGSFERSDAVFTSPTAGRGLGILAFRLSENDRYPSLYVTNDMTANHFFVADESGKYEEQAVLYGLAVDGVGVPNASMGVALLDSNGDSLSDLFVTNFDHEYMALYNSQGLNFSYDSLKFGLSGEFPPVVGFGVVATDLDCDGDEDVFVVNGGVEYEPAAFEMEQEPVLLENIGSRRFRRVLPHEAFRNKEVGRGCAVLDWNNDGYPELVSSNLWHSPLLYENRSDKQANWLRVRLIGRQSPRTPIGAIVIARTDTRQLTRQLFGGGSYLSQSQQELFFGFDSDTYADLEIHWPSGQTQSLGPVKVNQCLTVVEPE